MVCLITLVACVDHCTLGWSGCAMVLGKLSSSAGASYDFDHGGGGGGRVVRRCWVNFQCRGVLLIWIIVGQGPIALAIGAGGGLFGHFFSHLSLLFSFSLSLGAGLI